MAYLLAAGLVAGGIYAAIPAPAVPPLPYQPLTDDERSPYKPGEPVYTTEPDKGLPIRYAKTGLAAERFGTLPQLLETVAAKLPDAPALAVERPGYPKDAAGEWQFTSLKEYREQIRRFARALIATGFAPFKAVAICGFNGPYWLIAHMAATYARGLSAGTYTTNTPEACKYVADHSQSHIVVVDNVKTLQKYLAVKLATVKHIVVALEAVPADVKAKHGEFVLSWDEFVAKGDGVPESQLDERVAQGRVEQCCSLIYTSGTTGNPKAVMMSHDNVQFAGLAGTLSSLPKEAADRIPHWRAVSYLPLSHIAAQMLDVVVPLLMMNSTGHPYTVYFARPDALKGSLGITLKSVRPTALMGVPRVWEKMAEAMKHKARENPPKGLKLSLLNFAKRVGLECSLNRQTEGDGRVPFGYGVAKKLIFSKVREAIGLDQCIACVSGAAPIQRETLNFFASLGIDILEIYGMSETGGNGTVGAPRRFKFGCCGAPLIGQELKLDHDPKRDKPGEGEICYRGRHVMMGYLREEAKTRETIDAEGWLHSGDVGRFDSNHQLSITGRIKELIIGAGGENIAPVPIEDEIKRLLPALSNVVMIGDKRKYNVCLVSLKTKQNLETGEFLDELVGEALDISPGVTTLTAARNDPKFSAAITAAIKKYNDGPVCVSNAQKIQKFAILPTDLSVPGGELTATLKVKRTTVAEKYAELIDGLYGNGDD